MKSSWRTSSTTVKCILRWRYNKYEARCSFKCTPKFHIYISPMSKSASEYSSSLAHNIIIVQLSLSCIIYWFIFRSWSCSTSSHLPWRSKLDQPSIIFIQRVQWKQRWWKWFIVIPPLPYQHTHISTYNSSSTRISNHITKQKQSWAIEIISCWVRDWVKQ